MSLVMAALLAFALTACGAESGAADSGEAEVVEESAAEEETSAESDTAGDEEALPAGSETEEAAGETEAVLTFETTDLDGNVVSSADIFSANKLTAINLWGTYCGPCIGEMPDLEELSGRLAEKECAIVGVVIDVPGADDTAMVETAREILGETGVTYLNLVPWETCFEDLPAQFVPTTFFVDSEGHLVGEPAVGARGADEYETLIDDLLGTVG